MSKALLEQIYFGRPLNEEIEENQTYRELSDKAAALSCRLDKELKGEQRNLFIEFCSLQESMENEKAFTHFLEGFKMGLRLGIECWNDES